VARTADAKNFCYVELTLRSKGLVSLEGGDGKNKLVDYSELRHVDVSNNNIASIKEMSALRNVVALNAQQNAIVAYDDYEMPGTLQLLKLDNNSIAQLSPLGASCPELYCFSVSRNNLTSLSSLLINADASASKPCTSLRVFDASHNALKSIAGLPHFPNAQHVNLRGNQLESLSGIGMLDALETLDLAGNQLESLDELKKLSGLKRLRSLSLVNNQALYEEYLDELAAEVLLLVPQLTVFDGVPVTRHQRAAVALIRKQREADALAAKLLEEEEAREAMSDMEDDEGDDDEFLSDTETGTGAEYKESELDDGEEDSSQWESSATGGGGTGAEESTEDL
jgi:hypothetical protein